MPGVPECVSGQHRFVICRSDSHWRRVAGIMGEVFIRFFMACHVTRLSHRARFASRSITAAVRVRAWSLVKIRRQWLLTVNGLMASKRAIFLVRVPLRRQFHDLPLPRRDLPGVAIHGPLLARSGLGVQLHGSTGLYPVWGRKRS